MSTEDNKLVLLHTKKDSSKAWSVKQMLEELLNDEETSEFNKCLVLLLKDDESGEGGAGSCYNTAFRNVGMNTGECITLTEIAKIRFINQMGYGNE
jgi:hypothetical protein